MQTIDALMIVVILLLLVSINMFSGRTNQKNTDPFKDVTPVTRIVTL